MHVRSPEPDALPLIVTHGYPGSVVEYLAILDPLTDPRAQGGDPADAFHLVVPSPPGFGFSVPVRDAGWGLGRTTRAFAELMHILGYERYGAHGGDIGAGVSSMLGSLDADHVVGVHLDSDPTAGAGYLRMQATRPQTLGYALTDSPLGQLAWIVEQFLEWTNPATDLPEDAIDRDLLLTNVSLYWFTRTAATAANFVYEAARAQEWPSPSAAPQGWAVFNADPVVRRLLVDDLRAFFRKHR